MATQHLPLLEVRRVGRRHPAGQRPLLSDISLSLHAGQRLAITGPSGSGKTLLLRAMALLDPVDQGEVLWRGRPVRRDRVPQFRREVVYLHQRAALWDDSVEAALRQPFQLRVCAGAAFDPARATHLLGRMGRDGSFLEKRVRDLSGGEMQITALVRALQLDPVALLLDEPTAALDTATAHLAEELLLAWAADAPNTRALVWVTHDPAQADRIASHIVRIEEGQHVG